MTDTNAPADSDLLVGIEKIAAHLGMRSRQAYYLHDSGQLPTFKLGRHVCARRSTLTEYLAAQERAGRDPA